MAKVIKYSKDIFLFYLNSFKNKIYIYFYDLNPLLFDDVISRISKLTIEMKVIKKKIKKEDTLLIVCEFKKTETNALINFLDKIDIGEFEISEYDSAYDIEISHFYCTKKCDLKSLYINKDEAIIQLYNV